MGIDDALIQEIVRRILTVAKPDKIILFGSAATGRMTKDSDIDLLIVEPQIRDRRKEYVAVRHAIGEIHYPVDVLFITTKLFEQRKNTVGSVAYPANKQGKVVYEAA